MRQKLAALAVLATLGATSTAQAVTFSVSGGGAYALPGNFNPSATAGGLAPGVTVQRNAALSLTGAGHVTFSYVGAEAGYKNQFTVNGNGFDNKSGPNTPFTLALGPGVPNFSFRTVDPSGSVSNGASDGYYKSIALYQASSTTVFALFNDSSRSDKDYDDMVVRMDVAPVPLPAAAWLLAAGVGALGATRLRRPSA